MIRTAWPHDLGALRGLFASASDAPYDLAAVAEEKCFGAGVRGAPAVRLFEEDGRLAGAAVTCGRWLRLLVVAREARRRGVGTALLKDAESRGAHVVFAEPGNYFTPGISTTDEATIAFFHARDYIATRWTWNLDVALRGLDGVTADESVRRPRHEDADRVLDFVEAEFGRIWRFEAAKSFESDVPRMVLWEDGEGIAGFAVHDVNNRGLGFFGPTGVKESMRGRGIGRRILLASLGELRRLGYPRAVISWTDALDFYRKACGAEPTHRFLAMAKRNEADR